MTGAIQSLLSGSLDGHFYQEARDSVLTPGRRGAGAGPEAFLKSGCGPFEVVFSGKAAGSLLCSLPPPSSSSGAVRGGRRKGSPADLLGPGQLGRAAPDGL